MSTEDPQPTLREILAAVTSCNITLTTLTTEIKVVKLELMLVRQAMQKLKGRTAALEGRKSTLRMI